MSKQRSSGPHRRILARLCALALIAAMLLTSAYAGGAVDPMAEAAPAAEPRANANYSVRLSQNVSDHTVQLGIYDVDNHKVSTGWNKGNTVTFEQWNVNQTTSYTIRVISSGDYVITPNQKELGVTVQNSKIRSYNPTSGSYTFTATNIERPNTIQTADTLSKGVNIQLLDYTQSDAESYNSQFTFNGDGTNGEWNKWYSGQGVYQGILYPTIQSDGFPKLGDGRSQTVRAGGKSLSYLFNPESEVIDKAYSDLNYLFQYSKDTGYYTYDSAENFAAVVPDPENLGQYRFNVYNVPYQGQSTAPSDPKFLPFNDLVTKDGNTLDGNRDYHFGMTVDFQFLQPKDGLVNGQNMTFDFTGDDDVWLFIDGVLVLDMGGVHDAQTGSIDFATGQIRINGRMQGTPGNDNSHEYTDRLYNIMCEYKDSEWLKNNFNDDGTFEDYTTHTFQYYYMERGGGGSNCKIKFNLQSIPDDTIYVGKQITRANVPDFSDAQFDFLVEVKPLDQDGQPHGNYQSYKGSYKIYRGTPGSPNAEFIKDGYTRDGKFTLQHNQYAELPDDVKATTQYRVTELGAYSDQYDITSVDTVTEVKDEYGNVIGHQVDDLIVGEAPFAIFYNAIYAENANSLVITKEMAPGHRSDETFTVAIKIGGEPYANGIYYGQTEGGGIDIDTPKKTDDQGRVQMKAGEAISIMPLPWGTTFEVKEVNLNSTKYADAEYAIEGAENDSVSTDDGKAVGKIPLTVTANKQTTVTITNALKSADFTFTKVDADTNDTLMGAKFELWPAVQNSDGEWVKDSKVEEPYFPSYQNNAEATGIDGKATFTDIPFGNYLLYEVKAPAGYKLPKDPVRVTVKAGMVTLMNVNGKIIGTVTPPTEGESTSQPDVTIPNKENDKLPVAGGAGTLWFTGGGLALAGAAALLYFKQRRKKGEE